MPEQKEIILLQRDVEEHKQLLIDHIEKFDSHVQEEHDRWNHLIDITEKNAVSITELTSATKDIVDVWHTGESVVKAGSTLARFAKWLGSLGLLGAGILWVIDKLG